jgi:lysophospholipase L1-like esterase
MSALLVCALVVGTSSVYGQSNWVGTWAASQQIPEPANALAPELLTDATLRQIVHLSAGGSMLRVHISNAFGDSPLRVLSAHVARPVSPAGAKVDAATDRAVTFAGAGEVLIPPGAEYISDPLDYPVAALSDLAISLHLEKAPLQETGHPGSRATSYVAHGDLVAAPNLPDAMKVEHWYFLAAVDVAGGPADGAVVVLGDSITDGHGATINGNDRWPDVLARRLQSAAAAKPLGVLNEGIGGNHLLTDGLGPNALARFDRDVLAQASVGSLIVLEGVNDLGGLARNGEVSPAEHSAEVHRIVAAYQQIVARAHAHGIKVIGGTILPYGGSDYYNPGPLSEADRVAVNAWIRATGHFDAVVDFDKVMRDPNHLERLLPAYDGGDHLHPSPAGYRAMGEAIPLSLLQ